MNDSPLPSVKDVRDLLHELLARDVTIALDERPATVPPTSSTLAVYRDDARNVSGIVVTDLALSSFLGAALALISNETAEQAVADRSLPQLLAENVHEVLSVVGTLFNAHRPVRLSDVHLPGATVPVQLVREATSVGRLRMDLEVTVPGYGTGQMSVVR